MPAELRVLIARVLCVVVLIGSIGVAVAQHSFYSFGAGLLFGVIFGWLLADGL